MKRVLLYLWQLPQNLLGLALVAYYKPQRMYELENGVQIHFARRMIGGISLGKYSIVNFGHYRKDMAESLKRDTVRHEAIGHAKQSQWLGWFYLPVIGLPCICWIAARRIVPSLGVKPYHSFFTEKWADKLGGVTR